ncbi:MAG TPA: hypothetical protein VMG08_08010 [Allosphingosinicella sp.]|nr:hypothetical protein [Allosphingosinicella sp.]
MRNSRIAFGAGVALAFLSLGACVPRSAPPEPAPAPVPVPPAPAPRPVPPPPPAPPPQDWQSGPLSPGDWRYQPSPSTPLALFASDGLSFAVRCQQDRAIWLGVTGAQGDALVIRTSYGVRRLPAERVHLNEMVAQLPTGDPLLEQMAFSRGRFLVTVEGGPSLVVPAWPEVARVIEDCRAR